MVPKMNENVNTCRTFMDMMMAFITIINMGSNMMYAVHDLMPGFVYIGAVVQFQELIIRRQWSRSRSCTIHHTVMNKLLKHITSTVPYVSNVHFVVPYTNKITTVYYNILYCMQYVFDL